MYVAVTKVQKTDVVVFCLRKQSPLFASPAGNPSRFLQETPTQPTDRRHVAAAAPSDWAAARAAAATTTAPPTAHRCCYCRRRRGWCKLLLGRQQGRRHWSGPHARQTPRGPRDLRRRRWEGNSCRVSAGGRRRRQRRLLPRGGRHFRVYFPQNCEHEGSTSLWKMLAVYV